MLLRHGQHSHRLRQAKPQANYLQAFDAPFYNENNIFIIDRENINLKLSFFDNNYVDIDPILYEKLSIDGWIYNLFVDAEEAFWNAYV